MGLRSSIKRAFLRFARLYDEPYHLYKYGLNTKSIYASQRIKQLQDVASTMTGPYVVKIWVRNLNFVHKGIMAFARFGHWTIQVGDRFYELHLLKGGSPELKITDGPSHPFEGYEYKQIPKESATAHSPDRVQEIVEQIFDAEFRNHYCPGLEDYQRLCMRIWENIVLAEDRREGDLLYFKSFSFAAAYSTISPPTHLTTPKQQISSVPAGHRIATRDTGRRSHSSKHGSSHGGGVASLGWFQSTLALPPPR